MSANRNGGPLRPNLRMTDSVLSVRGLSKAFAGRLVVRDVSLEIRAGEVHALLGQNGSGKSTVIKILAGFHAPEPGSELTIAGKPVPLPLDAGSTQSLGLSFVHQDLALVPEMTVLENIRVGRYATGFGWRVRWRGERRAVREALSRFHLEGVSPDATVSSLREVERAMVAIVRALDPIERAGRGVLVLDEPTAYLPRDGVERLFEAVREVTASGVGVLFVTHRLDEVRALADRVTILRDGAVVETNSVSALSEHELVERIIGRSLGDLYPQQHEVQGKIALKVNRLAGEGLEATDFQVNAGEILGLTGLVGMGHERVPYLIVGSRRATSGNIVVGQSDYEVGEMTPRRAIKAGVALLPANRLRDGAAPEATVTENVTLATLARFFHGGRLHHREARRSVSDLLREFQVTPPLPELPIAKLSGGNQQKALLAKWFSAEPRVFLLHEPTQGVDIGARKQIFSLIEEFRRRDGAIVLISTEYEDLAHLCDRVMIFRDGRVVAQLLKNDLSQERIVERCFATAGTVGPGVSSVTAA